MNLIQTITEEQVEQSIGAVIQYVISNPVTVIAYFLIAKFVLKVTGKVLKICVVIGVIWLLYALAVQAGLI